MHEVKPAIIMRGGTRRPHVVLSVMTALMALWAAGSLVVLVVDLVGGADGVFEARGTSIPLWLAMTVSTLVAAYATWDTFMAARMTGSRHGLIDVTVEPGGIRLSRLRTWGAPLEVLVQRGETVELHARLEYQRRGGLERHYQFTVKAPGGSFSFRQAIHIEKLSLTPLDDAAQDFGIHVLTAGDATAIERRTVPAA